MCSRCQSWPCSRGWRPWWWSLCPCSPWRSSTEQRSTCSPWMTHARAGARALRQLQPVQILCRACVGAGSWQQLQPMERNPLRSRFVKDCIQWERSHAAAREKTWGRSNRTKCYEFTATFILHPLVLLRGRAGSEIEPMKEEMGKRYFQIFFFASHYPTLLLVSPSLFCLFWYFRNNSLYLPWLINFLLCLLLLSCWVVEMREQLSGHLSASQGQITTT